MTQKKFGLTNIWSARQIMYLPSAGLKVDMMKDFRSEPINIRKEQENIGFSNMLMKSQRVKARTNVKLQLPLFGRCGLMNIYWSVFQTGPRLLKKGSLLTITMFGMWRRTQ